MTVYAGKRTISSKALNKIDMKSGVCEVTWNDKELLPSASLYPGIRSHVKVFDWGYRGILSRNLAVSIICHFFRMKNYKDIPSQMITMFAEEYIEKFPRYQSWQIDEEEIKESVQIYYKEIYGEDL
jgi:hypothetical protein